MCMPAAAGEVAQGGQLGERGGEKGGKTSKHKLTRIISILLTV